jgi:isoquinoline 1-oxidoreductase beta subunit
MWKVDPASCRAENSQVIHEASGRRLSYGQLVEKASGPPPPQNVVLKDPANFNLIGKPTKRLDTPEKVNGKAVYGLDVTVPGMLTALIARPPVFGGKVKSFDAGKALAVPGVRHVVEVDRGIAVVADGLWPARRGREALAIVWDEGPVNPDTIRAQMEGGIVFGLTAALYGEITSRTGACNSGTSTTILCCE